MSIHRSRSRSASRPRVPTQTTGLLPSTNAALLSPKSFERERTLRELLEREVRERELVERGVIDPEEYSPYELADGTVARDPRLKLSYRADASPRDRERELLELERERELRYGRSREYPRPLDRYGVAAGDADAIWPYGEAKYDPVSYEGYERSPSELEEPYQPTSRLESLRLQRRRSRSPRARLESYAEERAREAEELRAIRERELERERRLGRDTVGARYTSDTREREEARLRRDARDRARERERERDLSSLSSGLGHLSVREREAALARERELDWELSRRDRARSRDRSPRRHHHSSSSLHHHSHSHHHRHHRPHRYDDEREYDRDRDRDRYDLDGRLIGSDGRLLSAYERALRGSPSGTALRSPLAGTKVTGSFGTTRPLSASYVTAPYSSTFGKVSGEYLVDPLRSKELAYEREREREERERERERDRLRHNGSRTAAQIALEREKDRLYELHRDRELELRDAERFGERLGETFIDPRDDREYDSDDDRVYLHPRVHGGSHAYFQRHFAHGHGEPVGATLGGGGTRGQGWMDEFYRPVDVRASKNQWLKSLQPPSYSLRNNPGAPEAKLKLEWIYGYKSYDVRNNLVYNNVGDIIYPVASVVVVYKHAHRIQRHFQAHNDEVRSIAQHPINLNLIASGQVASFSKDEHGKAPHIAIWDSTDFSKIWVLQLEPSDKSIRALAFSSDGKYLASVSNDVHHTIKLWQWDTRTLLGSSRGDAYAIFAIKWNHKDPSEFITVGKHHAVAWKFDGVKLTARKLHIPGGKNVTFYSVSFSEKGYACLGGEDGSIYVFVDCRLVREFKKVHRGKIFSLEWFPGGLISGGGDGVVNILDKKLDVVRSFTFHHRITSLYCRGNHLLIGTQGSQIFEIVDFMDTQIEGDNRAGSRPGQLNGLLGNGGTEFQSPDGRIGIEPIVQGHYDGELHGIATTPGGREIVSVGEDNQICVWEMTTHRLLRRALISDVPNTSEPTNKRKLKGVATTSHATHQSARSIAVSPNGKFIVVGLNNGEVGVYTSGDLRRVLTLDLTQYSKRQRHSSSSKHYAHDPHWIQCIKFSPNGHLCAVGTHGAIIALLDTRDEYRVKGVLQSHESFLTNIDFSDDGQFLASTDGQYQLKFHQLFENDLAQSVEVVDQRLIRDVKWVNQNCVLGYTVQGILETGESEGYLISCIEVSPSRAFVVSGDDAGQVQLFRHPVLERGHQSHAYHSHASNVVSVRWSMDEKYVVTAGGHDNAICQWTLV